MAGYESGLSYETLRAISDAGALDRLSKGTACKSRDKWRAVVTYQTRDGRQVFLRHTMPGAKSTGRGATSKTQADKLARAWREQVIADARRVSGMGADPTDTVRECIEEYIDNKADVGEIRGSTATNYRNAAKRIYKYPFAAMPLQDLTTATVQAWVADLAKTCAGKTVRLSYSLLDAVCRKMLGAEHNPCEGVTLPKASHKAKSKSSRPNALTLDGIAKLNGILDNLEAEAEADEGFSSAVALGARLALHTGMRAEEVCGLRWRDVDLGAGMLTVSNVIERAERPRAGEDGEQIRDKSGNVATTYGEYAAAPKTDNSERDIPLTGEIRDAIRAHRARMSALVAEMATDPKKRPRIGSLYVLGDINGNFLSPRALGKRWRHLARKHDLRGTTGNLVTFHDLRHTAATRMIAAGVDVATVSHILGHAENSVTVNKYVTSDEATKRAAMQRMGDVFGTRRGGTVLRFDQDRAGTAG